VDDDLVNPIIEFVDDNDAAIDVVNGLVDLTNKIVDVNFDEGQLIDHDWLHMMQQK